MSADYVKDLVEVEQFEGVFETREHDADYWEQMGFGISGTSEPIRRDIKLRTKKLDWKKAIAGQLVPASVKFLKERFKCPECDGKGSIMMKEDTLRRYVVHSRFLTLHSLPCYSWPELNIAEEFEDNLDYTICCPRCINYAEAIEDLHSQIQEFEDSLPERMEEYDAMMQEMSEDGESE